MLKKTVYFRTQEDLDRFNAIGNKAEWLHENLNNGLGIYAIRPDAPAKPLQQILNETNQAVVESLGNSEVIKARLCQHYQPKGKCMVKGCKDGR